MKKIQTLFILTLLVLFTGCVRNIDSNGLTLKIDESMLNTSSDKFPIEKNFVVADIQVNKPNIYIRDSKRIGATLDMKLSALFLPTTKGDIKVSGIPYYDKKESSIFLKDVKIERLKLSNKDLSQNFSNTLLSNLTPLINHIFKTIPVYEIEKNSFKGSFVKDVKIEDSELLVTFGL